MCLGIPGQVVRIDDDARSLATVEVNGVRREVNVALLMGDECPIAPGDWVLLHVGFAMARIDEDEAKRTAELIRQLDDVWEAESTGVEGT